MSTDKELVYLRNSVHYGALRIESFKQRLLVSESVTDRGRVVTHKLEQAKQTLKQY